MIARREQDRQAEDAALADTYRKLRAAYEANDLDGVARLRVAARELLASIPRGSMWSAGDGR